MKYVNTLHGRLDYLLTPSVLPELPKHLAIKMAGQVVNSDLAFPSDHIIYLLGHIMAKFGLTNERIPQIDILYTEEVQLLKKTSRFAQLEEGSKNTLRIAVSKWTGELPKSVLYLIYLHDFLVVFFLCLLVEAWKQRPYFTSSWLPKPIAASTCIWDYSEIVRKEPAPLSEAVKFLRKVHDPKELRDVRELYDEAAEALTAYALGFAYQGKVLSKSKKEHVFIPPSPRAINEIGEKNPDRLFASHPLLEEWCEQFLAYIPKTII